MYQQNPLMLSNAINYSVQKSETKHQDTVVLVGRIREVSMRPLLLDNQCRRMLQLDRWLLT